MTGPDYPRPRCATCGYPLRLDTKVNKWFCEVCKTYPQEFEKPTRTSLTEVNPAKPKGRWWKFLILAIILFIMAFVRVFVLK